jgi:hypothetical protein
MVREFRLGDQVRTRNGAPGEDAGVIVQCQPACVYRVQLADGTIRYYSGQQLVRLGAGHEGKRGSPISFTEERREACS